MSETILAFDLSMKMTGWCLIRDSTILEYGSFPLIGSSTGQKLSDLYYKASKLITEYEPSVIAAEDIFPSKYTMQSYRPLAKLQAIIEMLAYRLNRSQPQLYLASEVRSTFDINPTKMKKEFVEYSKKNGYTKTDSKARNKKRYDEFKKTCIVKEVNKIFKKIYPKGLLKDNQHDIADSILLALHVERLV